VREFIISLAHGRKGGMTFSRMALALAAAVLLMLPLWFYAGRAVPLPHQEAALSARDAAVMRDTPVGMAPVARVVRDDTPLSPPDEVIHVEVADGDTLEKILLDGKASRQDIDNAIDALRPVFKPRRIRPGQKISITLTPHEAAREPARLSRLELQVEPGKAVAVTRTEEGGFETVTLEKPLFLHRVSSSGVIQDSLYNAALGNGVPMQVVAEVTNIFSFDVDFQRQIQPGDSYAVVYEESRYEDGVRAKSGDILLAELVLGGESRRYYRFQLPGGGVEYFNAAGESARKALLKTPIDGARISSRYGNRRHPILGYTRKHAGVDFAAPTGTPVYAAGGGVVERAGWNGSYGKYVLIRHEGSYKSAYAHLSRIAVRSGARVRQGQVIGNVGSTGRSTGPHLHYEIHFNNQKVNPMGLRLPTGTRLKGDVLEQFIQTRDRIDALLTEDSGAGATVASGSSGRISASSS